MRGRRWAVPRGLLPRSRLPEPCLVCHHGLDPGCMFCGYSSCSPCRGLPTSRVSPRRATHLSFASPKESKQRKGDPMVWVPPLRYGQPAVLAKNGAELELGYRLRQSPVLIRFRLRSSAQPDGWWRKDKKPMRRDMTRKARHVGIRGRYVCTRLQHKRPNEVPLHRPAGRGRL